MNRLSWCDTSKFSVKPSEAGLNFVQDVFADSAGIVSGTGPVLETEIRATHSGHLINGRCYTGWGMRAGTPSWYSKDSGGSSAFDKPVIKNHDLLGDPIGRVALAQFTQLKDGDAWLQDWQFPDSGAGKLGSGYITTTCHIKDPDAISKIMDGRLHTVSTRQTAADAWCSIDGVNFRDGCDHEIGKIYEGDDGDMYRCYAVTGLLDYVEISYVGSPRQPNAVTTSFRMMRDALADAGEDGTILVGDSYLDFNQEVQLYLRSHEVKVDLSDTDLPSVGTITGKARVSMAGTKHETAPPSTKLAGLEDAMDKLEGGTSEGETKDAAETEISPFSNLARLWKDDLDLEKDFADGHYMMGITDKAARHAHAFEAYLDSKNKVMSGRTFGTGQGKSNHGHTHAIWQEEVDLNLEDMKGETRDAERGESHVHSFMASMTDGDFSCGTLIASVKSISDAIADLEQKANKDTFDSADALLKDGDKIAWDEGHRKAAISLLGRLNPTKRQEVILDMLEDRLSDGDQQSEENMADTNASADATTLRLMAGLMDDKESLTKKLAEASALADSKEQERQTLLEENKALKVSALRLKAQIIVDAQDRLSDEDVSDEDKKAKVDDLASKDESELDALLDAEVLTKLVKADVPAPAAGVDDNVDTKDDKKTTADLVAGKTAQVVPEREKIDTKDADDKGDSKSLNAIGARVAQLWNQGS